MPRSPPRSLLSFDEASSEQASAAAYACERAAVRARGRLQKVGGSLQHPSTHAARAGARRIIHVLLLRSLFNHIEPFWALAARRDWGV